MKISFLSFDFHLQLIAFVLILSTSIMIFPLILLVPFGAYQVLSAGAKGFALDSYRHRIFALVAGVYGTLIMYFAIEGNGSLRGLFDLLDKDLTGILAVFAYFIIPIISAIYYINESYKDWKRACNAVEISPEYID